MGQLTEITKGYFRSRVLTAAARLGVADALSRTEPRSVEEVAGVGVQPASLYRLLRALASFGVVAETTPRHFVLTPLGEPLRKDAPDSEWAAIVFWGDLLADNWSYLTECARTGENAARLMEREGVASRWSKDPNARQIFGAVMGTGRAENYEPIARAWDFSKHQVIADLGGGGGGLITAILKAHPAVSGMLVDRPDFITQAAARIEREGLASRCQLLGADLLQAVPAGAEVYLLKHVLHGYEDAQVVEILEHCRTALPPAPKARVLVVEFVLPDVIDQAGVELEQRLMSDLNMMTVTGGKERSAVEWKSLLSRSGFVCQGISPVPGDLVSIIEAGPAV